MTPVKGKHYTHPHPGWAGWDIEIIAEPAGGAVDVLCRQPGQKDIKTYMDCVYWSGLVEVGTPQTFPGLASHVRPSITEIEIGDLFVSENGQIKYEVIGRNRSTETVCLKCLSYHGPDTWLDLPTIYSCNYRYERRSPAPAATYTRQCTCDGKTLLDHGCQCGAVSNCNCSAFDKLHWGCRCGGRGGLLKTPEPEKKPEDRWGWP